MITLDRLDVCNFKGIRQLTVSFPDRGAILVEGPNESGKSTFFEAIYFGIYGAPIVTEEGRGSLESVVSYGADAASVSLTLRADSLRLTVHRAVRRSKSTRASLAIHGPGGEEEVSGVRAVNARIIAELGGLDGAALLNSCFVEQKKLSKLEELDGRERRDSLLRILNLEKLTNLDEKCRVRPADERRVESLADRLELAKIEERKSALAMELERDMASLRENERERRATALRQARNRLSAAEEHAKALLELRSLEREMESSGERNRHVEPSTARELEVQRVRTVLVGGTVSSALLLLALIAFAASAPLLGLVASVLTVTTLVISGRADYKLSELIAEAESRRIQYTASGDGTHLDVRIAHLRSAVLSDPTSSVDDELRDAERAVGREQLAVDVADEALARVDFGGGLQLSSADDRQAELASLSTLAAHLSSTRKLDPVGLDLSECVSEWEAAARDLEVRRRAVIILAEARRRLVERVLPETERNMKLILPLLTAGRYHDARITPDYRIDVWDDSAGRYVGKNVFSGGTKDQLSLALRLSFAVASLPQEMGSSPGFLFMDEPLSSFDEERTRALIELITRGSMSSIFPQICIISHSRSFDRSLFPFVVEMSGGRIAYTNLND